jgi:hypothetical protein
LGDGQEPEEVVVRVQGIVADLDLPPISQYALLNLYLRGLTNNTYYLTHRRVRSNKYRYIRQGITLIGPHCEAFTNGLGVVVEVQALFSRNFKEGQLDKWIPSFIHDEPGISASNRYFQHTSDTLPDDIMPLDEKVDPYHTLSPAAQDGFVHTINNRVEYYERIRDDKGSYWYELYILLYY